MRFYFFETTGRGAANSAVTSSVGVTARAVTGTEPSTMDACAGAGASEGWDSGGEAASPCSSKCGGKSDGAEGSGAKAVAMVAS